MVDEDGAWKQRIEKENRRLFEPNFLYDDFIRSRQMYNPQNTERLMNVDGRANMNQTSRFANSKPFDFGSSSVRSGGQALVLMRAPADAGSSFGNNNQQEDRYSRYSNVGSQNQQPTDESKLIRLRRIGAKKNRFNELLDISQNRRQGSSARLDPETLSQLKSQDGKSVLASPSQRTRQSLQSKVQSHRSASMYGNFMKRREADKVSEVAQSVVSNSNLAKLPKLIVKNNAAASKTEITQVYTPGGSRRQILSKILDRLCEMDSKDLAQIQGTLSGPNTVQEETDQVLDYDEQEDLAMNAVEREEQDEFDIEQV